MIKAVIFDLDGTLVTFNLDYKSLRAEVLQYLAKRGFPRSVFSMKESFFRTLQKAEIYMKNNDIKVDFQQIRKSVSSIANRYEMQAAHETSLVPNVPETLKTLKNKGFKIALFTANDEKPTACVLRRFRLKSFFDAVITRQSVKNIKPNPAHLEAVLKVLKVKPEEAIVVGDSSYDMTCAKGLRVTAIGITSRVSSEELTRAGATHIISSFIELPNIIEQLGEK
jgi:HAD superfamily hydrolase (TIGR01549 family)